MKHRYPLAALVLLAALALMGATGNRYNYGRWQEHQAADAHYHRSEASAAWSVVQHDYTTSGSGCLIEPALMTVSEFKIDRVSANGHNPNSPEYEGQTASHVPCSGYDYYPSSQYSNLDHAYTITSSLYNATYHARAAAVYMDLYQAVDEHQPVKVRWYTKREDFYDSACAAGETYYCSKSHTTTSCTSDANCASGDKCYPHYTPGSSGVCADATDEGLDLGFYSSGTGPLGGAPGRFLFFWMDGSDNDLDSDMDFSTFAVMHEYGHYLHDLYGFDYDPLCTGGSNCTNSRVAEMAAEGFARLAFARAYLGEGFEVDHNDRPIQSVWGFSNALWNGEKQTKDTSSPNVTGRAYADALWEILHNVDCTGIANNCKGVDYDDYNHMAWGTTTYAARVNSLLRAHAYAMDSNSPGSEDNFADKFLYMFENIEGPIACEQAEDSLIWHGFTGANCP